MQRIVRHTGEIRLRQIDCAASLDPAEKFRECGQVSSLPAVFIIGPTIVRLIQGAPSLIASLVQTVGQFCVSFAGVDLRCAKSLLRVVLQLLGGLPRLGTGAK